LVRVLTNHLSARVRGTRMQKISGVTTKAKDKGDEQQKEILK